MPRARKREVEKEWVRGPFIIMRSGKKRPR